MQGSLPEPVYSAHLSLGTWHLQAQNLIPVRSLRANENPTLSFSIEGFMTKEIMDRNCFQPPRGNPSDVPGSLGQMQAAPLANHGFFSSLGFIYSWSVNFLMRQGLLTVQEASPRHISGCLQTCPIFSPGRLPLPTKVRDIQEAQ